MKHLALSLINLSAIMVLAVIVGVIYVDPKPEAPAAKPKPDTVYIEVCPDYKPQQEPLEWLQPTGNDRLDIKPNSPEERQWQRDRKTYKPKYRLQPVEIN